MIKVLDHGYVDLVTHWGSDEDIIRAARMSTQKGFQGWGPKCKRCNVLFDDFDAHDQKCPRLAIDKVPGDEKLLKYLYKNNHLSPFEMCGASFEVQCPIFVSREFMRHRTFSFNEMSARYTELPKLSYVPSRERLEHGGQAAINKQSSGSPLPPLVIGDIRRRIEDNYKNSWSEYQKLLEHGVAREIARMVLPVSQYTKFRCQSNLRNWLHFLNLRLDESAQYEIRVYAQIIQAELTQIFPKTMELFACEKS